MSPTLGWLTTGSREYWLVSPSIRVARVCGQIPEPFPFQIGTLPFLVVLACELCLSVSKDLAPHIPEIICPGPASAFPLPPSCLEIPDRLQRRG